MHFATHQQPHHHQQHMPTAFHWEKIHGKSIPQGAVFASPNYVVIKAEHEGDTIVGKYNISQQAAYVPYGGKEVPVSHHVEVLVAGPGAHVKWVTASHGTVQQGAIGPIGKDGLFVGRAVCPQPENAYNPGKVHPGHKCLYMPWGGKEESYKDYEVCVIEFGQPNFGGHQQQQFVQQPQFQQQPHFQPQPQFQQQPHFQPQPQFQQQPHFQPQPHTQQQPQFYGQGQQQYNFAQQMTGQPTTTVIFNSVPTGPAYRWEKLHGSSLPHGTVYASDAYAVIKADYQGDTIVGKYNVPQKTAYIPYGGKEVAVTSNVEVLVANQGAQVQWHNASKGNVPHGAIGPFGKDGLFVGRAVCPQPENKHTPGKIHPQHQCLYMPWGGKENSYKDYEACVIKF